MSLNATAYVLWNAGGHDCQKLIAGLSWSFTQVVVTLYEAQCTTSRQCWETECHPELDRECMVGRQIVILN